MTIRNHTYKATEFTKLLKQALPTLKFTAIEFNNQAIILRDKDEIVLFVIWAEVDLVLANPFLAYGLCNFMDSVYFPYIVIEAEMIKLSCKVGQANPNQLMDQALELMVSRYEGSQKSRLLQ